MKRTIKVLTAAAAVMILSVMFASPAQAGGGYSFSFGYNGGRHGHRHHHQGHYGHRYYPRSYVSYSYMYAPPPVYYAPPPVVYSAPPPATYYYEGGVFYRY